MPLAVMNLCVRASAVDVVSRGDDDVPPPTLRVGSALRGRAQEIHRQLSHMREPVIAPRDELVINLDFNVSVTAPHDVATFDDVGPAGRGSSGRDRPSAGRRVPPTARYQVSEPQPPQPQERPQPQAGGAPRRPPGRPAAAAVGTATATTGASAPSPPPPRASAAPPCAAKGGRLDRVNGTSGGSGASGSRGCGSAAGGGGQQLLEEHTNGPGVQRGFVRVRSMRSPRGLEWSHSRKVLEVLIAAERSASSVAAGAGRRAGAGRAVESYAAAERRLAERLERLNLEMLHMVGDGNCQFRSLSNELYGSQEHHAAVRRAAVCHILAHRPAFEAFLGEDFDDYAAAMARLGTWGDELTLRAVCDSYGITVHVVTSDADNWYLTYEPERLKSEVEVFLTYIAPLHYNAIRRQSSLRTMALTFSRSLRRLSSGGSAISALLAPSGSARGGTVAGGRASGRLAVEELEDVEEDEEEAEEEEDEGEEGSSDDEAEEEEEEEEEHALIMGTARGGGWRRETQAQAHARQAHPHQQQQQHTALQWPRGR